MSDRKPMDRHGPFAYFSSGIIGVMCALVAVVDPGNVAAVAGGAITAVTGIYGVRAAERYGTTKAKNGGG